MHMHMHIHIHTYIHTYIHTLHYITLHYITLHYITLHYITLHYITLHYITLIHTYIHIHTYTVYLYIYISIYISISIYIYIYMYMYIYIYTMYIYVHNICTWLSYQVCRVPNWDEQIQITYQLRCEHHHIRWWYGPRARPIHHLQTQQNSQNEIKFLGEINYLTLIFLSFKETLRPPKIDANKLSVVSVVSY